MVSQEEAQKQQTLAGYCAYLIRLWQDSPYTPWRASAQSVQSGETVRFAEIEQLFTFLRAQTAPPDDNRPPPPPDDTSTLNQEKV